MKLFNLLFGFIFYLKIVTFILKVQIFGDIFFNLTNNIYAIDLAAYGTAPISNKNKVQYYYGYGSQLFDDIQKNEFNPSYHIDKISKVVI